jgi:site-specific DNA-cytosine methylase
MKHGSFFSGLGVIDYAAELLGWENIFQVEKDKWLTKRLNNVFKNTEKYEDIKTFDGTKYKGAIDIISGGDPCQPSSVAGNRKGKADDRYLWPEMFRCIKEIRPGWVFNENVTGTISNGILDQKIVDLESEGYACWPPLVISASVVGAPHERYRCFLIAYRQGLYDREYIGKQNIGQVQQFGERNESGFITYSIGERYEKLNLSAEPEKQTFESGVKNEYYPYAMRKQVIRDYDRIFQSSFAGFNWETHWHYIASEFCRVDDGTAERLEQPYTKGFDKGHRLKALGNGIVLPQIIEILCCINFLEKQNANRSYSSQPSM